MRIKLAMYFEYRRDMLGLSVKLHVISFICIVSNIGYRLGSNTLS